MQKQTNKTIGFILDPGKILMAVCQGQVS